MSNDTDRVAAFVDKLNTLFADSPYPGDKRIGRDEIREFRGNWKNLSKAVIQSHWWDLSYLDLSGFRYYMPALMRFVLLFPDEADVLHGTLLTALTPEWGFADSPKRVRSRLDEFSALEKEVIAEFLELYIDINEQLYFPDVDFLQERRKVIFATLEMWKQAAGSEK